MLPLRRDELLQESPKALRMLVGGNYLQPGVTVLCSVLDFYSPLMQVGCGLLKYSTP